MARSFAWPLAAAVAVVAVLLPLVPHEYRLWNYAAFGAVGLFAAARVRFGLVSGLAFGLGAKLVSDLLNYVQHGYDKDYLPSVVVYLGLAVYAVLGQLLLRKSNHAARIGGTAIAGGLLFFLTTNFAVWLGSSRYPQTFAGLMECYTMGLPFLHGTLLSDVTFTGLLFGLNALLEWATLRRAESIPVEDTHGAKR